MSNLEKSLFLVVNRLVMKKIKMYVSFPIEMIPAAVKVHRMILHAPLQRIYPEDFTLVVKEITGRWSEERIQRGKKPPHDRVILRQNYLHGQSGEVLIDLSKYMDKWRQDPDKNYGVYVKITGAKQLYFSKEYPPYLEVITT